MNNLEKLNLGEIVLKVLHIINNLGSGGAEKLIEEFLPLMNNIKGVKADVLLLTDKNNVFDKKLKENGVTVNVVPLRKIYSPFNILYIKKYIVERNYDVVHAHLFPTIYWTSIASKLIFKNRPKFIITEHSTHNRRRGKCFLFYIEKFIYFNYDKIISINEMTQEKLIFWLKPKRKYLQKFAVIKNGININKFREAEPYNKKEINSNFTESTRLVCMVGRLSKQKDQATLIKAMKNLPEDVHLLLIGEGPLKGKSKNLAKEEGVENRVHFLGFRNDVERLLKTCDIVVLSSNWEGFGLAAVEGMASGKPVLASDIPGLREVVAGAGILFPKGDSKKLAKIIKNLLDDLNKYEEISQECSIRASEFVIDKTVAGYIKVYEQSLLI